MRQLSDINITLDKREDAVAVMDALHKLLDQYAQVSVADYLELVGIASTFYDHKMGWTDLEGISLVGTRPEDGWKIILPDPKELVPALPKELSGE